MKYSLRSLMIVVTLFCVALGIRIEYLRRMAVFHEAEAERYRRGEEHLYEFFHHSALERKYRDAMTQPWTIVNESSVP